MRNLSCLLTLLMFFFVSDGFSQQDSAMSELKKTSPVKIYGQDTAIRQLKTDIGKVSSQKDSVLQKIQEIPSRFVKQVNNKIGSYSGRLNNKTEKTLTRLSHWENKIKDRLTKVSPETAAKLFGNNQQTFSSLLQNIKSGKNIAGNYKAKYDAYRESLSADLKYIKAKGSMINSTLVASAERTSEKMDQLDSNVANSEAVEKFIKQRKNELINESIKYIGKSKYLVRMNKDAYYYAETLRNYKEIFSDRKKAEETAVKLLNNIPAFQKFAAQHSSLAGLVTPASSFPALPAGASSPVINGIASRASLQQYMKVSAPALENIDLVQQIRNKLPAMPSELDQLKNEVNNMGKTANSALPDFKPNSQKSKPFCKRLEFGTDLQFGKSTNYLPATTDVGIKLGYKLNDKSSAGFGINYKIGMGNGWDKIHITSQGLGYRTYVKWKLKKGLDIQGGSEWNYLLRIKRFDQLKDKTAWKQSALLGLSKSYNISKKVKGNLQVLYDFLYNKNQPVTQPVVLRFGYGI